MGKYRQDEATFPFQKSHPKVDVADEGGFLWFSTCTFQDKLEQFRDLKKKKITHNDFIFSGFSSIFAFSWEVMESFSSFQHFDIEII